MESAVAFIDGLSDTVTEVADRTALYRHDSIHGGGDGGPKGKCGQKTMENDEKCGGDFASKYVDFVDLP